MGRRVLLYGLLNILLGIGASGLHVVTQVIITGPSWAVLVRYPGPYKEFDPFTPELVI